MKSSSPGSASHLMALDLYEIIHASFEDKEVLAIIEQHPRELKREYIKILFNTYKCVYLDVEERHHLFALNNLINQVEAFYERIEEIQAFNKAREWLTEINQKARWTVLEKNKKL